MEATVGVGGASFAAVLGSGAASRRPLHVNNVLSVKTLRMVIRLSFGFGVTFEWGVRWSAWSFCMRYSFLE
jgi:hypothetical protein